MVLLLFAISSSTGIISYDIKGKVCYNVRRNKAGVIRKNGNIDRPSTFGECEPIQYLNKNCFKGLGYKNCEVLGEAPQLGTQDGFNWGSEVGDNRGFCLQCCSNSNHGYFFEETWNMKCPTAPQPDIPNDIFEHEFHFARMKTLQDEGIVTCKLARNRLVHRLRTFTNIPEERRTAKITHVDLADPDHAVYSVKYSDGVTEDGLPEEDITQANVIAIADDDFTLKQSKVQERVILEVGEDAFVRQLKGYLKVSVPEMNSSVSAIYHDAVPNDYEELKLKAPLDRPGRGAGESVENKINSVLNSFIQKNYKIMTPVQVSRHGPYEHGAYTWSITFPQDVFDIPLLTLSKDGYRPDNYPAPLTYGDAVYEKVPENHLHGYHLTVEVEKMADDLGNVWTSVQYCTVNGTEAPGAPAHFYESFTVQRSSSSRLHQLSSWTTLLALLVGLINLCLVG